jgi:CRISPR-associated protein Csb2
MLSRQFQAVACGGLLVTEPPSPFRLFQALIAGSSNHCALSDRAVEALRWLEEQKPPFIIAPATALSDGYTLFVPNNGGDREPNRQKLLTGKTVRPRYLLERQTVHYVWPISEAAHRCVEVLCQQARQLSALGWASTWQLAMAVCLALRKLSGSPASGGSRGPVPGFQVAWCCACRSEARSRT